MRLSSCDRAVGLALLLDAHACSSPVSSFLPLGRAFSAFPLREAEGSSVPGLVRHFVRFTNQGENFFLDCFLHLLD